MAVHRQRFPVQPCATNEEIRYRGGSFQPQHHTDLTYGRGIGLSPKPTTNPSKPSLALRQSGYAILTCISAALGKLVCRSLRQSMALMAVSLLFLYLISIVVVPLLTEIRSRTTGWMAGWLDGYLRCVFVYAAAVDLVGALWSSGQSQDFCPFLGTLRCSCHRPRASV